MTGLSNKQYTGLMTDDVAVSNDLLAKLISEEESIRTSLANAVQNKYNDDDASVSAKLGELNSELDNIFNIVHAVEKYKRMPDMVAYGVRR